MLVFCFLCIELLTLHLSSHRDAGIKVTMHRIEPLHEGFNTLGNQGQCYLVKGMTQDKLKIHTSLSQGCLRAPLWGIAQIKLGSIQLSPYLINSNYPCRTSKRLPHLLLLYILYTLHEWRGNSEHSNYMTS